MYPDLLNGGGPEGGRWLTMADVGSRSLWRRLSRRAALPVLAVAATATLTGCSVSVGGSDLDTGDVETEIQEGLADEGVEGATVECPEDIEAEDGAESTCTATAADGSTAQILVTQTDDDGSFRWRTIN